MSLTFFDLFAGAGGWSLGFEESGFRHLAMYDSNASACRTAKANFGDIVTCADLSDHKSISFPAVDVICGSPPCQGFSNEGYKRKDDPRNSLVWAYLEIIEALQPRVWVFENVPGFKGSYGGHYYELLRERLRGWDYHWRDFILNAADYGVPQNRKRFVLIAAKDFQPSAPAATHTANPGLLGEKPNVTLRDAIADLPHPRLGDRDGVYEYDRAPMNSYQEWARADSSRIHNHTTQNHSQRVVDKIKAVPMGGDMRDITPTFEENRVHYCGGYRRATWDRPSWTAYWTRGMTSIHPEQNRFLSPRECARIQSFPDRFVLHGATIENYTQVCNAVPPLLARAVATEIRGRLIPEEKNAPIRAAGGDTLRRRG